MSSEEERLRRALARKSTAYRTSRRPDGSSYSHPVSGGSSEDYLRAAVEREKQAQRPQTVEEQVPTLTCWKCGREIVDQAYQKPDKRIYCSRCRNGIIRGELKDEQDALLTDSE